MLKVRTCTSAVGTGSNYSGVCSFCRIGTIPASFRNGRPHLIPFLLPLLRSVVETFIKSFMVAIVSLNFYRCISHHGEKINVSSNRSVYRYKQKRQKRYKVCGFLSILWRIFLNVGPTKKRKKKENRGIVRQTMIVYEA